MEAMTETENTFVPAELNDRAMTPAAARDFVKKAAEAAKEQAMSLHASAEKATSSVEQTLMNSVGEVAKLARQAHQAVYEDAEAFLSGVDKLASAKGVGEVVQIYVDYLRDRGDVAIARTRAASDYVGKLLGDGSKTVQDNIAKVGAFSRKAA
jgi:phasin